MSAKDKKQPTKGQAVFMGVVALLWLTSNVVVLVEGRPATVFFWIILAMNLVLLGWSLWLYRQAVKSPQTRS